MPKLFLMCVITDDFCGHAKASKGTLQKVRRAADRQAGEERNQVKDERGRFGNHMAELLVLHSAALRSHQGEGEKGVGGGGNNGGKKAKQVFEHRLCMPSEVVQ